MKGLTLVLLGALTIAAGRGSADPAAARVCTPRWHDVASVGVPDLADIAALSPTDVWAVGLASEGSDTPVIAHWDGRKLAVMRAFRPSFKLEKGLTAGSLTGIVAVSPTDIWAVGTDGNGFEARPEPGLAGPGRPVVEHWNGKRWRVVPTPNLPAGAGLSSVTALSRDDVWTVGQVGNRPLAEHWDGRRWKVFDMRREGTLSAVDAASPRDVWAVGAQGLTAGSVNDVSGLVMHWNGRRWQEVAGVDRDDADLGYEYVNAFDGIDAVSGTEAWATHHGAARADVQRWDGRRWRLVQVFPEARVTTLADIVALSSGVAAVGSHLGERWKPAAVSWDGRSWHAQDVPFNRRSAPADGPTLNGVSVLSPTDVWGAGDGLIVRYSCS